MVPEVEWQQKNGHMQWQAAILKKHNQDVSKRHPADNKTFCCSLPLHIDYLQAYHISSYDCFVSQSHESNPNPFLTQAQMGIYMKVCLCQPVQKWLCCCKTEAVPKQFLDTNAELANCFQNLWAHMSTKGNYVKKIIFYS